jgi:hypothetical protein
MAHKVSKGEITVKNIGNVLMLGKLMQNWAIQIKLFKE